MWEKAHTGLWFCDCCINELPADRLGFAAQMGDQLGPVAIAVGVGLDMVGAVGQDLAGLVQGIGVLVDDGVVAAGVAVFSDFEQGIDAAGGLHHPVGSAPAPGEGAEFVISQADCRLRALGGELLGHPVEGVDIGLFGRRGLGAGETHHHKDKAVFGHLIRWSRFSLPVLIGNERKIALVEIFGTVEGGDLTQHVFVLLAKHFGDFQGGGDRLALVQADDLGRGKAGDGVHGVIPLMRCKLIATERDQTLNACPQFCGDVW